MTGISAMDDGSRCLLDVIGDPSALQSFLEEGDNLKNSPSTSLDDTPLQVDFCIRTNGSHIRTSPTLLKQAAAAAAVAGGLNSFQVSATQTVSTTVTKQAVCSTQAPSPSPAYHQPATSPQITHITQLGHSPLNSRNATPTSSTHSPAPSPFSVPSRSPAQPIPSPSPSTQNKSPVHAPPSKSPLAHQQQQQQPVVQFVSTAQARSVKPIQPKQPHLLPKPAVGAGAANGMQFAKNRNHAVSPQPSHSQLVINQAGHQPAAHAAMLPNASVTSAGTLLLNHHILGLAHNPILIQGNAGGIQNLQLLMRPQQTTGGPTPQGQQPTSNNQTALMAALQVQNQAAQQALLNHNKGQTMVIPTGLQQHNKPANVLVNAAGQQIHLQQIQTPQGPITIAITPQQLRGIQQAGVGVGAQGPAMLQGVALSQATSLPAGVVLNRQVLEQRQSVKAPGVNLEELLKQAGIVPADTLSAQPQMLIPTSRANSQLITQLQQPITQLQQSGPAVGQQVKLSIAQDGSVFLQRPMVTMAPSGGSESVLMQRLGAQQMQQQIQIPISVPVSSAGSVDAGSPLLPLTVQNINLSAPQTQLFSIASGAATTASVVDVQGGGQLAAQHSVLAQALSQKAGQVDLVSSTATVASIAQPVSSSVASVANGAAVIKSETTNVLLASAPITAIPAGQKLQTIQLSPQNQEILQKVQAQLRTLSTQKTHTPQQRQMIQQLQATQQKILAQGKVISIQQAPANTLQLIQQQATLRPMTTMTTMTTSTVNVSPKNNTSTSTSSNTNVHLSNLLKQAPANLKATNVSNCTPAHVAATATHIKVGNQLVTMTTQQRQTIQQFLKALTPEQQQLYSSQNKPAVILKLQQQTQPTGTAVSIGQPTPIAPAPAPAPPQIAVTTSNTGGLLVIQTIGKGLAQVKSIVPAIVQDQQNRGVKRPAPSLVTQGTPIQQQLTADQNGALKTDCKMPFRSVKDACRRLLKYHVFNSKTPTPSQLMNADRQFETVSEHLLHKARKVFSTYRCLLLKESVRQHSSAEVLMLNKLFVEDEKTQLQNDKDDVKQGKELNLPPLPPHWIHKMDAVSEDSKMSVCVATTFAATCASTVTTTVHTAPLSSPSSKSKPRDATNYDEWAEIQKELEMYDEPSEPPAPPEPPDAETPVKREEHVMDAEWGDVARLSESEAAVESILMPLGSDNAENLTDIDEFEPSYAASDSKSDEEPEREDGEEEEREDDEEEEEDEGEEEDKLLAGPLVAGGEELNAQVESAINSILHLQQKEEEEFDEYMDGEYELEEEEKDKEGVLSAVNEDASMEYDGGAAISLDTQEMDAALEEAVKSIM